MFNRLQNVFSSLQNHNFRYVVINRYQKESAGLRNNENLFVRVILVEEQVFPQLVPF